MSDPVVLAEKALALMDERRITCLFVVSPDALTRPVGVLKVQDILRAGAF